MAILRLGPLASGISGSLGGLVFVAGKNGTVVRPRPAKRKQPGPFAAAARTRMYNYRRAWPNLTQLQRDAWSAAAADFLTTNTLGLTSPIGGFQLFVLVNARSFRTSANLFLDGPIIQVRPPGAPTTASFSAAGDYDITATRPLGVSAAAYHFYGYPFMRDTPSRDVPRWFHLFSIGSNAPGVTANVRTPWLARFGAMVQGQRFAAAAATGGVPLSALDIVRGTVGA